MSVREEDGGVLRMRREDGILCQGVRKEWQWWNILGVLVPQIYE